MVARLFSVILCVVLTCGCNGSLVGDDYRGEPLFTIQAQIASTPDVRIRDANLRVSLFWSPSGKTDVQPEELIEQESTSVALQFPNITKIHIYHTPLDSYIRWEDPRYGVALILVYDDRDGNGRLTPSANPRELLGGAFATVVLYAPYPLEPAQSPTDKYLPPGFYVTHIPLPCGNTPEVEERIESTKGCGVPLGAVCENDAECGTLGECLHDVDYIFFPGGYCVQPYSETGCRPKDGVLHGFSDGDGHKLYWYKGCRSDRECRLEGGYECSHLLDACLPELPVWMFISQSFYMKTFCKDP